MEKYRDSLEQLRAALSASPSIKRFAAWMDLSVVYNEDESLMMLTYNGTDPDKFSKQSCKALNLDTERSTEIRKQCRGLILEAQKPWKCVSRGFDRFERVTAVSKEFLDEFRSIATTEKEDGSSMQLFKRGPNDWQLGTLHNFAEDTLYTTKKTYAETFIETMRSVYGFETLAQVGEFLERCVGKPIMTACFELCTSGNRVIRLYDSPQLVLLGLFGGDDGMTCYNFDKVVFPILPGYKRLDTITFVPNVVTFQDAVAYIASKSKNDPTFEGLVMLNERNERLKVKNLFHLRLHRLKFRGLTHSTPDLWIEHFLQGNDDQLLRHLKELYDANSAYGFDSIAESRQFYRAIYDNHLGRIRKYAGKPIEEVRNLDPLLHFVHRDLFEQLAASKAESFDEIWRQYISSKAVQSIVFKFENSSNRPAFLPFQLWGEEAMKLELGMGVDGDHCACGEQVRCIRLRQDLHLTYLKNSQKILKSYPVATEIMQCFGCGATHECRQKKSLGYPGSALCRELRIRIHKIIDEAGKNSEKEMYEKIGQALFGRIVDRNEIHMSCLSVPQCVAALRAITVPTFALAFMIDDSKLGEKIDSFREKMDPDHQQWPPHLKILDPFKPSDVSCADKSLMAQRIQTIKPFSVNLECIKILGSPQTIAIQIDSTGVSQLRAVFDALGEGQWNTRDFVPLITIGRGIGFCELSEMQKMWQPEVWHIKSVTCLVRYGDERYREFWSIPLNAFETQ